MIDKPTKRKIVDAILSGIKTPVDISIIIEIKNNLEDMIDEANDLDELAKNHTMFWPYIYMVRQDKTSTENETVNTLLNIGWQNPLAYPTEQTKE
jgi:hypothetical protein